MTISIVNKEDFIPAMNNLREAGVGFVAAGSLRVDPAAAGSVPVLNGRPALEILEDDDALDVCGVAHLQMCVTSKLEEAGIQFSVHTENIDELEAGVIS